MITAFINRQPSRDHSTFGIFFVPDLQWCCVSLERSWVQNVCFVSCIPCGEYICEWTYSKKFERSTYQIRHVKKRTGIRIHPANLASELSGCVAFGRFIEWDGEARRITDSRETVKKFEKLFNKDPFKLVIRNENNAASYV